MMQATPGTRQDSGERRMNFAVCHALRDAIHHAPPPRARSFQDKAAAARAFERGPLMKKIIAAAFASTAALALAACGSSDKAADEAAADNVEMPAEEAMPADAATAPADAMAPAADASAAADAAQDAKAGAEAAADAAEKSADDAKAAADEKKM